MTNEDIGSGRNRTRIRKLDDGTVEVRERVRDPGDPAGLYHRAVILPEDDVDAADVLTRRGLSNTHLGTIRARVKEHRTPERLALREERKRYELEVLEPTEDRSLLSRLTLGMLG